MRQSSFEVQLTRQTQPVVVTTQEEPDEQLALPAHELEQVPPGVSGPVSQRMNSHSVLFAQGPPTNLLSLPAWPAGPLLPHATTRMRVGVARNAMRGHVMTGRQ